MSFSNRLQPQANSFQEIVALRVEIDDLNERNKSLQKEKSKLHAQNIIATEENTRLLQEIQNLREENRQLKQGKNPRQRQLRSNSKNHLDVRQDLSRLLENHKAQQAEIEKINLRVSEITENEGILPDVTMDSVGVDLELPEDLIGKAPDDNTVSSGDTDKDAVNEDQDAEDENLKAEEDALKERKKRFEKEKKKQLKKIPKEVKKDFRQLGFGKWGKSYLPIIQLGPYDVGGSLRESYLEMLNDKKKGGKDMKRLVFWYGNSWEEKNKAFSFLNKTQIIDYEEGKAQGLDKLSPALQGKVTEQSKKLTSREEFLVNGLTQMRYDSILPPESRIEWMNEFEETYETESEVEEQKRAAPKPKTPCKKKGDKTSKKATAKTRKRKRPTTSNATAKYKIGTRIRKKFGAYFYEGEVTSTSVINTHRGKELWYMVCYTDGDKEELAEAEIDEIVVSPIYSDSDVENATLEGTNNSQKKSKNATSSSQFAVGTVVRKFFNRIPYYGKIASITHPSEGETGDVWYRIDYEDGDSEDIDEEQLKVLVVSEYDADTNSIDSVITFN